MAHEILVTFKGFCSGNPTGSFHCGHHTKLKVSVLLWRLQQRILLLRWIFIRKSWRLPFRKDFLFCFSLAYILSWFCHVLLYLSQQLPYPRIAGQAWSSFISRDEKDAGLCCLELSAQGRGNLKCRGKAEQQTQHHTSEQNMQLDSPKMSLAGRQPFTFKSI